MRGTNSKNEKHQKNRPKITFMGLQGAEIGLENREPQKAHLGSLLNVLIKFQLPNSIWREDRAVTALFQGQKGRNPRISPLLSNLGG